MSASKLGELRAALEAKGVRDVKFFFAPPRKAISDVADDAAKLLSAYLNGKTKLVKEFNGKK